MAHLTEDELASRWAMTTKTLYRWRTQNKGPSYMKLGKKILYPLAAVEAYESQISVEVEAPSRVGLNDLSGKKFSFLIPQAAR